MQHRFPGFFLRNSILTFFLLLPFLASAQDPNAFVVKKWRPDSLGAGPEKYLLLGLTSGYGFSTWNHSALGVYQGSGNNTLLFPSSGGGSGYFNLAQTTQQQSGVAAGTDKKDIVYKGKGGAIPVNLDILYNIGKFRIGIFGGYEFYRVSSLKYEEGGSAMQDLSLSGKRSVLKYGLQAEFVPVDLESWRFGVMARGGMFNLMGDIDKELAKKGRLVFGGGVFVEKPLNDAFIAFAAPTYEHRSYSSDALENGVVAENTIGTIYLNVGIRVRLDNLFTKHPLCPIPSCHTRKIHMHNKAVYRGQPWFKKQNPRVGENLPKEKVDKKGNRSIKKPYVIKEDPQKQAEKAKKISEKGKKREEKQKNKVLKTEAVEGGEPLPEGAQEIGEDTAPEEGKKARKKRKKKGEEPPAEPESSEDDY